MSNPMIMGVLRAMPTDLPCRTSRSEIKPDNSKPAAGGQKWD